MDFEEEVLRLVETEYRYYQEIKELVDKVGVAFEAIPDGLLLEVRAFTGHISDAISRKEDVKEDRLENLKSAHHHLRRIELDCYKALCVYEFLRIKDFERKYKFYNLSDVDDGNFVQTLDELKKKAEEASKRAKSLDFNGSNSKHCGEQIVDGEGGNRILVKEVDILYNAYQDALNAYCDVTRYIDEHRRGVSRIAKKNLLFKIISVAGWVVSFGVSVAFGIVSCVN